MLYILGITLICIKLSVASYVLKRLDNVCISQGEGTCKSLQIVRNATAADKLVPGQTWIATAQHNKKDPDLLPWNNLCHWGEGIFPIADSISIAQLFGKIDRLLLHQIAARDVTTDGFVTVKGISTDWFINTAIIAARHFNMNISGHSELPNFAASFQPLPIGAMVRCKSCPVVQLCESIGTSNRPTCFQRLIMVDRTSFDAHNLITFHSATKARLYRDSVLRWTAATREQGEQDISRARTPGRHVLLLLRTPQKGRRKSTRSRHWINEKSIIRRLTSILEARCWTLTVKHLDAETTTLREQVRDFAHSDIIISQHGAQLTNLVFLRDEGAVIESFSCRHRSNTYSRLAKGSGVVYASIREYGERTVSHRSISTQDRSKGVVPNMEIFCGTADHPDAPSTFPSLRTFLNVPLLVNETDLEFNVLQMIEKLRKNSPRKGACLSTDGHNDMLRAKLGGTYSTSLCADGILGARGHCCSQTCGSCDGGKNCSRRNGGPDLCCLRRISKLERICHEPADIGCIVLTTSQSRGTLAEGLPQLVAFPRETPPALRSPTNVTFWNTQLGQLDKFTLIVSYFQSDHPHTTEVKAAISENLLNPWISRVLVLLERMSCAEARSTLASSESTRGKIACAEFNHQPTYADFFEMAHRLPPIPGSKERQLVMISNADVVFDHSLSRIDGRQLRTSKLVIVLSVTKPQAGARYARTFGGKECDPVERCDVDPLAGHKHTSWDTFIFGTPVWHSPEQFQREKLNPHPPLTSGAPADLDFVMNLRGAELRASYALHRMGLRFSNPCRYVRAEHWHCTEKMRPNKTRVNLRKFRVAPCVEASKCLGLSSDVRKPLFGD